MKPPVPRKETKTTSIHVYELNDEYHWMRDRGETKKPEIIEYLEAENQYTEQITQPFEGLAETINKEIVGRIKQTDLSVPYKNGDHWYFSKTIEGKQYPVYYRAINYEREQSEVTLDQNELAEGFEFFSISNYRVSDDGNLLAYATDTTGYRQYTLHIKDLRSGELLPNEIERVVSIVWSADGKYIFYVQEDEVTKRNDTFWRHDVASNKSDLLIKEEDVLFNMWASRSRDKKFIFVNSAAATMDECRYLSSNDPLGDWTMLLPREGGHEYSADYYGGSFYLTTNRDAENFRVVQAPIDDPASNWKELIPHDPDIKIEGIDFFKGFAVVSELENGLEFLRVIDMASNSSKSLETPETVYSMGIAGGNVEFDTTKVRYGYSSMITPESTFEYDLETGESELLKQQEVLGGYKNSGYETTRVWAEARDGVKVPVSIVMKKGTKLDGSAPMLLYAYGSYGYSITPGFSIARLSLLDRGMIYGIAHVRGGSELGEKWRMDGRMFKKLNTFYDFIDCANWLAKNGYTSADRLVIQGGSAGGLLMGGVVNMSPSSFKASIAAVPFVDVINTMLDETLPLTTQEWIEWGNPNEKEAFDYMYMYAPYENIKKQDYPGMLVLTSLWDSQVPYWEGSKFVARLRDVKTDNDKVLLKTNMGGGHGGSSGRYDRYKEIAFEYAYALSEVGITK